MLGCPLFALTQVLGAAAARAIFIILIKSQGHSDTRLGSSAFQPTMVVALCLG